VVAAVVVLEPLAAMLQGLEQVEEVVMVVKSQYLVLLRGMLAVAVVGVMLQRRLVGLEVAVLEPWVPMSQETALMVQAVAAAAGK
jgi:hypothetical protein